MTQEEQFLIDRIFPKSTQGLKELVRGLGIEPASLILA